MTLNWTPRSDTAAHAVLDDLITASGRRRTGNRWQQARHDLRRAGYITPHGITPAGIAAHTRARLWDGRPHEALMLLTLTGDWQPLAHIAAAGGLSYSLASQRLAGLMSLEYAERHPDLNGYPSHYRATPDGLLMQEAAQAFAQETHEQLAENGTRMDTRQHRRPARWNERQPSQGQTGTEPRAPLPEHARAVDAAVRSAPTGPRHARPHVETRPHLQGEVMKTASQVKGIPQKDRKPRNRAGDATLGSKLSALRESFRLTQQDVIDNATPSVSRVGLAMIETGEAMPTVRTLVTLAAFYETSIDELTRHMIPGSDS